MSFSPKFPLLEINLDLKPENVHMFLSLPLGNEVDCDLGATPSSREKPPIRDTSLGATSLAPLVAKLQGSALGLLQAAQQSLACQEVRARER